MCNTVWRTLCAVSGTSIWLIPQREIDVCSMHRFYHTAHEPIHSFQLCGNSAALDRDKGRSAASTLNDPSAYASRCAARDFHIAET